LPHRRPYYNEAIRLDPKFVNAYLGRGNALSNKQEYDKAIADDNEAIRLDPTYALPDAGRALTLFLARREGAVDGVKTGLQRHSHSIVPGGLLVMS
jgi:tetratricopeptide (TPR) repeat protein